MTIQELTEFLEHWIPLERGGPYGELFQRERLAALADHLLHTGVPGDLVEIGCLHGSTTVLLAEVAKRHGRKVISIDPWQIGTQNCSGGEYEIFCRTIEPFQDVIEVLRLPSQDPKVAEALFERKIALAFVDGLHEYLTCLRDIYLVRHAAVIAVDDTNWSEEVQKAFGAGAAMLDKVLWTHSAFRESYMVPRERVLEDI